MSEIARILAATRSARVVLPQRQDDAGDVPRTRLTATSQCAHSDDASTTVSLSLLIPIAAQRIRRCGEIASTVARHWLVMARERGRVA
jgi:hypothetical protein